MLDFAGAGWNAKQVFPSADELSKYRRLSFDWQYLADLAGAIGTGRAITLYLPPPEKDGSTCKPLVAIGSSEDGQAGIGALVPLCLKDNYHASQVAQDRERFAALVWGLPGSIDFEKPELTEYTAFQQRQEEGDAPAPVIDQEDTIDQDSDEPAEAPPFAYTLNPAEIPTACNWRAARPGVDAGIMYACPGACWTEHLNAWRQQHAAGNMLAPCPMPYHHSMFENPADYACMPYADRKTDEPAGDFVVHDLPEEPAPTVDATAIVF